MAGQPRQALQITDRAHERGADLGMVLQDLLELTHTVTRLKSVPALRDSPDLPEAERTRGAALADRLSVPVLARAWQMLLKGVGEVETAPDRRAAAEMVLIRLCHVADLPTPGDLVRRLSNGAAPASGAARARRRIRRRRRCARSPAAAPHRRRPTPPPAPGELPRRRRAGRRAARGDAARASGALGAPGALRPAGDRAAAAAGGAARPRGAAGRAAGRGDRHALDDRAVHRRGRADPGRAGHAPPMRRAARRPPITRWCGRSWTRSPARGSTRCTTPPPMPMVCRRSKCRTPNPPTRWSLTNEEPLRADEAGAADAGQDGRRCRPSWRAWRSTARPAPAW